MTPISRTSETIILRIECTRDDKHFYFRRKCFNCFRKYDEPPNFKLAMHLASGGVVNPACSCVVCKTSYCKHSLALTLNVGKTSFNT